MKKDTSIEFTCPVCGDKFFQDNHRGGSKLYCSRKCYRGADNIKRKNRVRNKDRKYDFVCQKCYKPSTSNEKSTKYCSRECYLNRNHQVINNINHKKCSLCKVWKPLSFKFFGHSGIAQDGFACGCKECHSAESKTIKAKENRKELRSRPHVKAKIIKKGKEYRSRPEVKKMRNLNEMIKKKEDPSFSLSCRIRILMYHSIRKTKNSRKWEELVGYTCDDLRKHIERLFTDGMSWDKFMAGEIHIDHIRPVSSFNFTCPEDPDFKLCWALENLQPLWAVDNMKKSNKIINNGGSNE